MKSQDDVASYSVTIGVEVANLTPQQGKRNVCAAFYGLDGELSRHKFAQYVSKDQQDTIASFKLEETLTNEHYIIDESKDTISIDDLESRFKNNETPEEQLKLLLKNDQAAEFISKLAIQARDDMSSCLGVDPGKIDISITTSGKDGDKLFSSLASLLWHKDINEEGEASGMRLSMALVGKPTLFSDDSPKIYTPIINADKPGDGVDVEHINNIEEAQPGEVAVFSMGSKNGAAHAIPVIDGPRLFILLDCYSCPSIMHSKVNSFQTMIDTVANSSVPLIQQFNNTVPELSLESTHKKTLAPELYPQETSNILNFAEALGPSASINRSIGSSDMIGARSILSQHSDPTVTVLAGTLGLAATALHATGITGLIKKLVNPNKTQAPNSKPKKTKSLEDKIFVDSLLDDKTLQTNLRKTGEYINSKSIESTQTISSSQERRGSSLKKSIITH